MKGTRRIVGDKDEVLFLEVISSLCRGRPLNLEKASGALKELARLRREGGSESTGYSILSRAEVTRSKRPRE